MIAEIASLITSSKAAYDIAKGVSALKSEVDRNENISKILEILLAVQTNALSVNAIAQELQEQKHELTQRLMQFEKWSETETQYELKEIAPGVFLHVYKTADDPTKPIHWLCPACYTKRTASILQKQGYAVRGARYACLVCKAEIIDTTDNPPSSVSLRPGRR